MNKRRYILFQYECKKCFTHLAIFLIILFIPIRIAAAYFEFRESNEDKLYKEVVTDYEGGAEQAVIAEIKERYEQYTKLLSDFPNIQIQYALGRICMITRSGTKFPANRLIPFSMRLPGKSFYPLGR